jgi:hypothetical protein
MTTVVELVARLRARGVTLEPDGPTLVVRPVSAVHPDEVAALRQHKAEVLALLRTVDRPRVALSYAHPWPDAIDRLGRRRVGPFAPCEGSCGRWSWVRYGDVVLCLPCANLEAGP